MPVSISFTGVPGCRVMCSKEDCKDDEGEDTEGYDEGVEDCCILWCSGGWLTAIGIKDEFCKLHFQ